MLLVLTVLRAIFVSWEFVSILVFGITALLQPDFLFDLVENTATPKEFPGWLGLAPAAVMAIGWQLLHKILFPEKDTKNLFQHFPLFAHVQAVGWVGLGYFVVFSLIGISSWALSDSIGKFEHWALGSGALVGAGITYLSMYSATLRINRTFAKSNQPYGDR